MLAAFPCLRNGDARSGGFRILIGFWWRPAWEDYFNSTRAHNTVQVDDIDYPRDQGLAYGAAVQRIECTADGVRIIMEVRHVGLETWHRREITCSPGRQLTVSDTMQNKQRRRYVQWLPFARAFELSGEAGRFLASDDDTVVDVEATSSCGEDTTYR